MASTSASQALYTFTATATAGSVFQTQLPTTHSSSVATSILGGGVNPIEFHSSQYVPRRGSFARVSGARLVTDPALVLSLPTSLRTLLRQHSAIQLLVVQLVIIICLSRFLHWGFTKLCPWTSQPRVCFEILAGILLGPTAFGQIPRFSENIFPNQS